MIHYEKYWLSRIISIQAIVSADYINGCHHAPNHHTHQDAWEMIFVAEGTVSVRSGTDSLELGKNSLILIQPSVNHDLQIDDPRSKTFVLSFVCSNDAYLFSLQNTILHAVPAMLPIIDSIIWELSNTFAPQSPQLHLTRFIPDSNSPVGAEQMICCYLEQLLILLLRGTTMVQGNIASYGQFHKAFQTYLTDQVTDYIRQNLSGQLTVQQIADHFHYSRARLSSLYKEATGISISEAITNSLIQEAKNMLRKKEKSIFQISEELGFSSPQYFSYKFTKAVGMPPSRYAHSCEYSEDAPE